MYEDVDRLKEEEREAMFEGENEKADVPQHRSGLITGLVLIGLGVVFLWQNLFGYELLENWWALFILIPAVSRLAYAWRASRARGNWGGAAGHSLTWGLVLATVALIFLFGLEFGNLWPVLIILVGVSLLLRGR